MKNIKVTKASGDKEVFDIEKLRFSLKRSGANDDVIESVIYKVESILYDGIDTREIYSKAFKFLQSVKRSTAARYKLKKALMELGPSGYPFEHFIGQLLKLMDYEIAVGQIVKGKCVNHEVDVIARKGKIQYFVECKYYNSQNKYANVQVPLYIKSRVDDIISVLKQREDFSEFQFKGCIMTNTRFTSDAIQFGTCVGLELISWDYPENNALKDIIEKYNVFPITALTTLNNHHKKNLMEKGIVLCRQLAENKDSVNFLGLTDKNKRKLFIEVNELCGSI